MNDLEKLLDAFNEAKLIIQCASITNEAAHGEGGGAWSVNSDFQKRIDSFLDKYGRFPTEADQKHNCAYCKDTGKSKWIVSGKAITVNGCIYCGKDGGK